MRNKLGGNRLYDLERLGQSVWLECSDPDALGGSKLARLIRDGISGIDSTLASFTTGCADDPVLGVPCGSPHPVGTTVQPIHERFGIQDLRHMADRLRRVYEHSDGRDGYANVEVSPALVDDAHGTESEASRLYGVIDRPNVMIKIPATAAGVIAMRRCIGRGLNVNATLIYGARRYREVIEAYLLGLEDRLADRLPLERVASVASISVSDIDTAVDAQLDAIAQPIKATNTMRLRDKAAVAVSQYIYQRFKSVIASPRWRVLAANHAKPQRLLWASTQTNDAYDNGLSYINQLVGRDTVSEMSLSTLDAYVNHGVAAPTLERDLHHVIALFGDLEALGISLDRVGAQLERRSVSALAAGNTASTRLS